MDETDDSDTLLVNCGRCGESFIVRLRDIVDKRTIDCPQCENAVLRREAATHLPEV
jgi:DNA-directed RNA polymerase subunit RPC12/RpoP